MDETSRWVVGGLVLVLTSAVSFLAKTLRDVRAIVAGLSIEITRLKIDVGTDSHSGLRGATHKHKGQIGTLAQHVDELRSVTRLRPLDLAEEFRKERE